MDTKNRSKDISQRNNDRFQDIKIDLYDIDNSIKYYFDNVILPKIDTGYGLIDVPIVYSTPARWASIKKYGTFRDSDGKIQSPMVTYKRTSIAKSDDMPVNKISAENPQLFYTYEQPYNSKNRYSQFSKLTGTIPSKQLHHVVVPDYVVLSYDIIIWTDKLKQMNKIIELMNFYAGSYWGTLKWKFKSEISDYSDSSEVSSDGAKMIKWTCSLTLNGYIVPDIYAKHLPNTTTYSPESIVVDFHTNYEATEEYVAAQGDMTAIREVQDGGGGTTGVLSTLLRYIDDQNYEKVIITEAGNVATFPNATIATSPVDYLETDIDDFMFFTNGVLMDTEAIISFEQVGADVVLTLDPAEVDWLFEVSDEVIVVGKFE